MELTFPPCNRHIFSLPKTCPKKGKKNSDKENLHSFFHSLISFKHLLSNYRGNVEMKEGSSPGCLWSSWSELTAAAKKVDMTRVGYF